MRNLKRVLALALALVMVIGMMVMGASAASYPDAADITADYEEAVAVMSGVGMFQGDEKGNFAPATEVTRAQAAVMLARLMLTKSTADKLIATQQIFSDVPLTAQYEWCAAEIEYCYQAGLIDGRGDGSFAPDAVIDGLGFAKLLLVAMGYDADAQGYVGADWATNIAIDALTAGLNVEDVVLTTALTREVAAQMLFQALDEEVVKYTTAYDYATGAPTKIGPVVDRKYANFAAKYFPKLAKDGAGEDEWGRPYTYAWTVSGNAVYVAWETPLATYNTAVSDCDIAKVMGLKKSATVEYWDNGYEGGTYLNIYGQAKENGAQGVQIEVYSDRVVRIDTYLAQVGTVHAAVVDKNGHVKEDAYSDVTVYDAELCCSVLETTMDDVSYTKGDMILVNVNYTCGVYALQVAESFVGTQTYHYINAAKHEIDDVIYNDAEHLHQDAADDHAGKWIWYLDQFGNLIGSAAIPADASSYAVIKSIQWINREDEAGYAKAVLVDMNGDVTTTSIYSIDGDVLVHSDSVNGSWIRGSKAYVSSNYSANGVFLGLDLYEVKTYAYGAVLTRVDEIQSATVATGVPVITSDGTTILVDNNTQYLVRGVKNGSFTYTAVTGYENIGNYTDDAIVDYVLGADGKIADYVYLIGTEDSVAGVDFVYITSNANIKVALATLGGDEYYVVSGVIRGDGSTDPLYVLASGITRSELVEWVTNSVGKLFKVETLDGLVGAISSEITEVVEPETYPPAYYAMYSGKVTTIGAGMVDTTEWTWNTNAATIYVNQNGVMAASSLKVGNCVYVIGSFEDGIYKANIIFVTDNDVAASTLAKAKADAIDALKAYAAEVVVGSYIKNIYSAGLTVADIQDTLDAQIKAVNDATTIAAVTAIIDVDKTPDNTMTGPAALAAAAVAKANALKAAADEAAADTALAEKKSAAETGVKAIASVDVATGDWAAVSAAVKAEAEKVADVETATVSLPAGATWVALADGSASNFTFVVTYGLAGVSDYTNSVSVNVQVNVAAAE